MNLSTSLIRKNVGGQMDLLCRKGLYPYEWVAGIEKLDNKETTDILKQLIK